MEAREPDRTTDISSRSQYMQLDEARCSHDLPVVSPSQVSQYAPLHPSTLSWEILRDHVTIEKIIGKGAFGQVAKGMVVGLGERPQGTLVAVKMLKGAKHTMHITLLHTSMVRRRDRKKRTACIHRHYSFFVSTFLVSLWVFAVTK